MEATMRTAALLAVTLGIGLAGPVACGGSTNTDPSLGGSGGQGGGNGGSGNAAGTGGIDCSNVGCAEPPRCDVGCTAACGCCSCGDGEKVPTQGGYLLCTGGCYTFVAAATCGGMAEAPCAKDEFCDYPTGSYCGGDDSTGVCVKRPEGCPEDCPGVCGCDGNFHCNACSAQAAGVDVSDDKSCLGSDGGVGKACAGDAECPGGLKCCYPCGMPGCQNECMPPMPDGSCPAYP
jgi:hypothetical protein